MYNGDNAFTGGRNISCVVKYIETKIRLFLTIE